MGEKSGLGDELARRRFLRTASSTGALLGLGGTASANPTREREINSLEKDGLASLIKRATRDTTTDKLLRELRQQYDVTLRKEDSMGASVEPEQYDSYKYIILPFDVGRSTNSDSPEDVQAHLVWFSRDIVELLPNTPRVSARIYEKYPVERESLSLDFDWKITQFSVDGGAVSKDKHKFFQNNSSADERNDSNGEIGNNAHTPPSNGGGGCVGENCNTQFKVCESINFNCIVNTAATLAGTVVGCAACLSDFTKLSCGLCIAALAETETSQDCDFGNNCHFEYHCTRCGEDCYDPRICTYI